MAPEKGIIVASERSILNKFNKCFPKGGRARGFHIIQPVGVKGSDKKIVLAVWNRLSSEAVLARSPYTHSYRNSDGIAEVKPNVNTPGTASHHHSIGSIFSFGLLKLMKHWPWQKILAVLVSTLQSQ